MAKTKAVIFDIGGVVITSPINGIRSYEKRSGLPPNYISVAIAACGRDGAFQRLERGELQLPHFYRLFGEQLSHPARMAAYRAYAQKRLPNSPWAAKGGEGGGEALRVCVDGEALFREMMGSCRPVMAMLHAVCCLKSRGIKVAALTNNFKLPTASNASEEAVGKEQEQAGLKRGLWVWFDQVIESAKVGVRKPDPLIYRLACQALCVQPSEAIFLDDLGVNLKAAAELGMRTLKVPLNGQLNAIAKLQRMVGFSLTQPLAKPITIKVAAGFGGGVLECDVWGHLSGAPVVMLHGGGQTRHSWNKTAAALAAIPLPRMHAKEGGGGGRFCVLTLDQKGHGGSYWDARAKKGQAFTAYGAMEYGRDVDAFLEALQLGWAAQPPPPVLGVGPASPSASPRRRRSPLLLVGASLGGLAAMACRAASVAAGVVLVDITPRQSLKGLARILGFMARDAVAGFESLEQAARAVQQYTPHRVRDVNLDTLGKNLRRRSGPGVMGDNGQGGEGGERFYWHWDPCFIRRYHDILAPPRRAGSGAGTGREGEGGLQGPARAVEETIAALLAHPTYQQEVRRLERTARRNLALGPYGPTPALLILGKDSDVIGEAELSTFQSLVPHLSVSHVSASHMIAGDSNDPFTGATQAFLTAHAPPHTLAWGPIPTPAPATAPTPKL